MKNKHMKNSKKNVAKKINWSLVIDVFKAIIPVIIELIKHTK